jgi:NADPH-dependent ferric siderophore reductase
MKECYSANVLAKQRLTPSMIRLKIGAGEMQRFRSSGFADEWVRLIFPAENGSVTMPHLIDGRWQMPEDLPRSSLRPYTVRQWDREAATITVDFVVHDGGLASDWATNACVGDEIGVTSPHGKYAPPGDAQWILLIADATGLPAVARILEEKHCDRQISVHVEIPTIDDAQADIGALGKVTWHAGFGCVHGSTRLLQIAEAIQLPDGPGYIWVAGEAKVTNAIRRYLTDQQNLHKEAVTAIGYWIIGKPRD